MKMMQKLPFLIVFLFLVRSLQCIGQQQTPLLAMCPCVRFEIVMGRLTAIHCHNGELRLTHGEGTESIENLRVICSDTESYFRYERETSDHKVFIEIFNGRKVDIQSTSTGRSVMNVSQDDSGIAVSDGSRQWRAATIWHLWLSERELCDREIKPLLAMLRSDWDLASDADRLKRELLRLRKQMPGAVVSIEDVAGLVAAMDHSSYQMRRAADISLRRLGPSVRPYLLLAKFNSLSSEQRVRIRGILEDMEADGVDTPERVSLWLAGDTQIQAIVE